MTRFQVAFEITCPSDWTEEKARSFVTRQALSTKSEKDSLVVTEAEQESPK